MKKSAVILLAVLIALTSVACVSSGGNGDSSQTVSNPIVTPSQNGISSNSTSSADSSSGKPDSSITDSSMAGPSSSHTGSGDDDDIISRPKPDPKPEPEPQPDPSIHDEHYCYAKLTDRQKEYYEVMHDAVQNMQTEWIVLGKADKNYKTDVAVVRNALANDHPDIFWLPSYYATAIGTNSAGTPSTMIYFATSPEGNPSYLVKNSKKDDMADQLEKAVKEITGKVTATDPYEIELQLHDLLCETVDYSNNTNDPFVYTSYGALVNKKAVCEGYTRAMQLLLSRFGILSVNVTGIAGGEGHMWNAVYLNNEWYHLDVTWNDSAVGMVSHEYFNVNDTAILLDHTFNKNYYEFGEGQLDSGTLSFNIFRPAANGTEYNYFNRSGFVLSPDGISSLCDYLAKTEADTVEILFSNVSFRNEFDVDSDRFIKKINEQLSINYPDCGFHISGYVVSSSVLRLYNRTEQKSEEILD